MGARGARRTGERHPTGRGATAQGMWFLIRVPFEGVRGRILSLTCRQPDDTSDRPQQAPFAWQRFTVLDLLLLQAGFATGIATVSTVLQAPDGLYWGYPAAWVGVAVWLGAVLSGPLVLGVQYLGRDRSGPLGDGERLWLLQLVPVGVIAGLGLLLLRDSAGTTLAMAVRVLGFLLAMLTVMAVVPLAGFAALAMLLDWLSFGRRRRVPCPWTDLFGNVTTVLTAVILALLICMG